MGLWVYGIDVFGFMGLWVYGYDGASGAYGVDGASVLKGFMGFGNQLWGMPKG